MLKGRFRAGWSFSKVGLLIAGIPLGCGVGLFVNWQDDNAIIRQQAVEITRSLSTESARIRAINHWVYHNEGFGKNEHYFLIPALGPTPIQVIKSGGDCADKSRLVAAMLNELSIDAGGVMIKPCPDCPFIHSVVEARYEDGRMVVDPVWDVDYPAANGRFLGVRDLAGTHLGREHVAELQRERGATDKIAVMPATEATFDYAVAVNWDKNFITRAVAETLRLLAYSPESMFRPRFLEDPKLSLILFLIGATILVIFGSFIVGFTFGSAAMRTRRRIAAPRTERLEPVDL
jgi:hypothetical protein